nr:hypothetical protein [Tanacetum cinerariifolium]
IDALVDPVDPQGVDVVKRLEFTVAIPPAMGQGLEFGDFGVVDVTHVVSSKTEFGVRHGFGFSDALAPGIGGAGQRFFVHAGQALVLQQGLAGHPHVGNAIATRRVNKL